MTETLKLPFNKSMSLDRCDIFQGSSEFYPDSYQEFQKSIERIFFKSELLLKCKLEFERLITIDLPNTFGSPESLCTDKNLSLIFAGAIKSGRSSLINTLLNAKVLPTNRIGSSCCISILHPKNDAKSISVGIHDLDGWEVDKHSDINICDLPKKITDLQNVISRNSSDKNDRYSRRIHVQLPHWLLKNVNIHECPAIDGMYSFEEPFELIVKFEHSILIYLIDASNGLMQWDRTFLAKVQNRWPYLPVFFVINHVDIREDILSRDQGPRFLSISDKFKEEQLDNESSDLNSSDDNNSESIFVEGIANISLLIKEQKKLIERTKTQIKSLGFMLENGIITRFASLSVSEFIKILSVPENARNSYWELANEFFRTFNGFLKLWFEHLLITSSLKLKSQINGAVDAVRCQIISNENGVYDVVNDIHLKDIKKAEYDIKVAFQNVSKQLEKDITKSTKQQLKKHEASINTLLSNVEETENSEIIRINKPKLLEHFEKILLGAIDQYNIDDEISIISEKLYRHLDSAFIKTFKYNRMLSFFQYELNLFRTLKRTVTSPVMLHLPDDIIQTEHKWYKDVLQKASRRILRSNPMPENVAIVLIDDIKVSTILKNSQFALGNIYKQIQYFTKSYKETYRMVRCLPNQISKISPDIFKRLLLVDFVLIVIEKSFHIRNNSLKMEDLNKLPKFFHDFYDHGDHMIKCINIQSFTCLADVINILCFERICQRNSFVMSHHSTQLLDNGFCLLYYQKMDLDLLTAIQNDTIWKVKDIVSIVKQLLNAVKTLQYYNKYMHIDLLPENIILKIDSREMYECQLFPFSAEVSSIGYKYRSKRKFKTNLDGVIFQIGMVISWLLTNDIWICTMVTCDRTCSTTEFYNHISERTLHGLEQTNLIHLAIHLLFKPEEYINIETVQKELEK